MKNIVIASQYLPPKHAGGGVRAYNYARQLNKTGCLRYLITQYPFGTNLLQYQQKNNIKNRIDKSQIIEIRFNNKKTSSSILYKVFHYFLDYAVIYFQVVMLIMKIKNRVDITHCFATSDMSFIMVFISKLFNIKTIIEITCMHPPGSKEKIQNKIINSINNKLDTYYFLKSDKIIVLSPLQRTEFLKIHNDTPKLTLIPNGINTRKFKPLKLSEKTKLRNVLNITKNHIVLLFVGAIENRKGISVINRIIKRLNETSINNLTFLFVGEYNSHMESSELLANITQQSQNMIKINVRFTGHVHNVNEYMMVSDIFLFPSFSEGLPNAVLEAMASGLPVIMNEILGISDSIIRNKIDGFIVSNNDVDTYIKIIIRLIKNSDLRSKVQLAARRKIEKYFTEEIITQKYQLLYQELLK